VLQVLEQLCREVQQQATLYQESIRDAAELQDTTGVELFLGRGGGKARPMVEIKAEKVRGSQHSAWQQQRHDIQWQVLPFLPAAIKYSISCSCWYGV
jgi:hypothetical protein